MADDLILFEVTQVFHHFSAGARCLYIPIIFISKCVFKYTFIFHAYIRYTKESEIAPGISCGSSIAARELSSERTPEVEAG